MRSIIAIIISLCTVHLHNIMGKIHTRDNIQMHFFISSRTTRGHHEFTLILITGHRHHSAALYGAAQYYVFVSRYYHVYRFYYVIIIIAPDRRQVIRLVFVFIFANNTYIGTYDNGRYSRICYNIIESSAGYRFRNGEHYRVIVTVDLRKKG